MEDGLALIEICGGMLKADMDYSALTNEILLQNGGVLSLWSLSFDEKRLLRTYRNINQIKLFPSGKYFVAVYALGDGIEIELYDASRLQLIKQKKIIIDIPDEERQLIIKKLFLSFILKDTLLIIVKSNNKKNWLIQIRFEKLTFDIIEEFIGLFEGKVKNAVGCHSKKSNAVITVNSKKICYWSYNNDNKDITNVNKINPKLKLDYKTLSICNTSNLIGLLSDKGDCLIYDMSASCKGKFNNEANSDRFTYLSLEDGIVVLGSFDGKVYVYDQSRLNIKYVIETEQKNSNDNSLFKVILNEEKDILILIQFNGSFEYYSLSSLLKNKQMNPSAIIRTNHHTNTINALEWVNESSLTFYTSSADNQLIKWYYRGDKWINESQSLPKGKHFTCLKVHPQFNNILFATDNNGNIIQIDLWAKTKTDSTKTFRVANFPIEYLAFNKGNYVAFGFNTGMIMIYTLDFNSKCDFSLLLYEDFINEDLASKKTLNNHMTSFIHFLSEDNMLIFRSGITKIALAGINRINNVMVPSIEEELEYDTNDDIINITVHPSDKYIFVLLQSNQINIRKIITWKNMGVIDLSAKADNCQRINIDYTGTFLSVESTNIKGTMKNSNILIYEIASGELVTESGELFPISKHIISNDGRFIIATGIDGTMSIIKLSKEIKEKMYCVFDLINSNDKYWKTYSIGYPIQKRVIRTIHQTINENIQSHGTSTKNIIKPNEKVKGEIKDSLNNCKDKPLKDEFKKELSFNTASNKNKNTQENQLNDNKKKSNLNNQQTVKTLNTSRDMRYNNMNTIKSNYFNIQTNQKCNTMDTFNDQNLMQNISWDKQKQYSQLGYPNRNMVPLNNDPNIFSINQHGLIQKVNQTYLNSQVLAYPQLNKNLIESSSKSQQDEIRYRNITNAIQQILTLEDSKMTKSQSQLKKPSQSHSQSVPVPKTQGKIKSKMNVDYFINNTRKTKNYWGDDQMPDPEGIDDLSIMNTKDNRKDTSFVMNKSDISFISTLSKNCKMSVTDDIDYINDNIERFEHRYDKDDDY